MNIEKLFAWSTEPIVDGTSMDPSGTVAIILLLVIFAILIVQGYALYKAARLNEKGWFAAIFLLNTLGILPAIYLYLRRDKRL